MSVALAPVARQRVFTDLGVVSSGALWYTYVGGTPSTPLATTSDSDGLVPNTNPIVASAGGLFGPVYVTSGLDYHFVITDALGGPIWDQDHILVPVAVPFASPAFTGTPTAPTAAPGTNTTQIATTAFVGAAITAAATVDNQVNDFRLTLTTAVPVTTPDVLAATTLYCSPYLGNRIALYDGALWNQRTSAEFSIAIPATTSQLYDVFVYDNAGVPTLELLAWTNDTTRATALVRQDGVLCKTGALTRRYVGSVRTTAVSGQTESSASKRFLWNYSNRKRRLLSRQEATATWANSSSTVRQANAAVANAVFAITGVAEDPIVLAIDMWAVPTAGSPSWAIGVGVDSTTVFSGLPATVPAGTTGQWLHAAYQVIPTVGYHAYNWLEVGLTGNTVTFTNTANGVSNPGLYGWVEG